MRAVVPAALITMFGIGAQLGVLASLVYSLSAESSGTRAIAVAAPPRGAHRGNLRRGHDEDAHRRQARISTQRGRNVVHLLAVVW